MILFFGKHNFFFNNITHFLDFVATIKEVILLVSSEDVLFTLKTAPERVKIEGRFYRLTTYLWRDFMPRSAPDGKPLMAVIKVIPFDSLKFPETLDADRLWVINVQNVWETDLIGKELPHSRAYLEKRAKNGPKWNPGITVDVIVRLATTSQNTYLLKASNQIIHQTY